MASLDYRLNPLYTIRECSTCGALYNKSCGCSKGGLIDKFVRDPNKTPDSSQRPPQDCVKCGNPVEGPSCQGCALWRKKLKEVWFTICHENGIYQDLLNTSESSDDNTNVVNAPREPFVVKQDPGENSRKVLHKLTTIVVTSVKEEEKRIKEEQAAKARYWKIPVCYDDDDDEESSIPLKDIIISGLPPCVAITPVLFTKEPVDSLIMEDEHLDTIPETESDELIKSSVEDLVQIPSESEDSSEGECDLPPYDDSSKNYDLTFSNPLFDIDEDFTSSDESFSEEDVPMKNFKFFSNPLFDLDEEIIATEVNLIQNEVLESITSIPPGIDSFDAESNLIESLPNRNTSIDSSSKIDSLLDEFSPRKNLILKILPSLSLHLLSRSRIVTLLWRRLTFFYGSIPP
ncbi:hypothetical protein Tco_1224267, partial [Tanacetum coccineum]